MWDNNVADEMYKAIPCDLFDERRSNFSPILATAWHPSWTPQSILWEWHAVRLAERGGLKTSSLSSVPRLILRSVSSSCHHICSGRIYFGLLGHEGHCTRIYKLERLLGKRHVLNMHNVQDQWFQVVKQAQRNKLKFPLLCFQVQVNWTFTVDHNESILRWDSRSKHGRPCRGSWLRSLVQSLSG